MLINEKDIELEEIELEDELKKYEDEYEQKHKNSLSEEVKRCMEEGKACSYCICSECPLSVKKEGSK